MIYTLYYQDKQLVWTSNYDWLINTAIPQHKRHCSGPFFIGLERN